MASLAASVARLTQPKSQTWRGRSKRLVATKDMIFLRVVRGDKGLGPPEGGHYVLSLDVRRERTVLHNRHIDRVRRIALVFVNGKPAIAADRDELVGVVADDVAGVKPPRAVELDPDALEICPCLGDHLDANPTRLRGCPNGACRARRVGDHWRRCHGDDGGGLR